MEKNISARLFTASLSAREQRLICEVPGAEAPKPQFGPREWQKYDPSVESESRVDGIEATIMRFPVMSADMRKLAEKKDESKKAPESVRTPEAIKGEIDSIVKDLKARNVAGTFEVTEETQKKLDRMSALIKDYRGMDDGADQLASDTAAAVGILNDASINQSFGLNYDAAQQKFSYKKVAAPEAPVPSVAPTEQQKTWLQEIWELAKEWFRSILKEGAKSGNDLGIMRLRVAAIDDEIKEVTDSKDYKDKNKKPNLDMKIKALQAEKKELDANIKAAEAKTKQFVQDANTKVSQANQAAQGSIPLVFGVDKGGVSVTGDGKAPAAVVQGQLIYLYSQLPPGTALDPRYNPGPLIINRYDNRINIGDGNSNINIGSGNAAAGGNRGTDAYSPNRIYRDSANSGPNIGPYRRGGSTYNMLGRKNGFREPPGSGGHNAGH